MSSNHLILCCPLLLSPSIFPSIRVFSNESALCIRWPKYWSFSFSISPSNEHSGLISFRMHCLDLLAVLQSQKLLQFKNLFTHKMCTHFSAPSVQAAAGAPWITYCSPTLIPTCKTLQHANKQVSESKHRAPCKLKEFPFSCLYLSTVQMFTCPIHVLHIPDLCLSSLYFKIKQINAAFQEISWVMASQPLWHGLDPLQPSLLAPSKPSAGAPQSLL